MQLSNELAQKRYERLKSGLTREQEVIEVKDHKELEKEIQRILKDMHEGGKACTYAHYILDDNEAMGSFPVKNVKRITYDDLSSFFSKLTSTVMIKGVGIDFESDKEITEIIVVRKQ